MSIHVHNIIRIHELCGLGRGWGSASVCYIDLADSAKIKHVHVHTPHPGLWGSRTQLIHVHVSQV